MTTCRSCEAPIRWAITEAGRPIPVDHDPVDDGNLILREQPAGRPPLAIQGAGDPGNQGQPRYKSHFATCPNAAQHRRSDA